MGKFTYEDYKSISNYEKSAAIRKAQCSGNMEQRIIDGEATKEDLIWFYVHRDEISDVYEDVYGVRPNSMPWYSAIWEDDPKGFENYRAYLRDGLDVLFVGDIEGVVENYDEPYPYEFDSIEEYHQALENMATNYYNDRKSEYEYDGDDSYRLGERKSSAKEAHRIREALANLPYYGFKRVASEDFIDDGTRLYMWVWDPEGTGKSPFFFSKVGDRGYVYFSEQFSSNLIKEAYKRGYHLDDLNGVSKSSFTDEALGSIVKQLQEIRESDWFDELCPEFSVRGTIDRGVEVKDYIADKDHQRVMDIAKRADSNPEKMAKLAANMAKAIGDKEKMRSRWQAAIDIYGKDSPVAKAFENQVNERGWRISIRDRQGDIDWSGLFESVLHVKESLPVDQRDDYQEFLKQQAQAEKNKLPRMKAEAKIRRLERHAQRALPILESFLSEDLEIRRIGEKGNESSVSICNSDGRSFYMVDEDASHLNIAEIGRFLSKAFSNFSGNIYYYGNEITISGVGRRSDIGPLAGKLKKGGLNVKYEVSQSLNLNGFATTFVNVKLKDLEDIELFNEIFDGSGYEGIKEILTCGQTIKESKEYWNDFFDKLVESTSKKLD